MFALIIGGAASGKSALAERLCTSVGDRIAYIATMQPFGDEALARIARHLKLREGKGFITVEQQTNIGAVTTRLGDGADTLLIECLSNLCANEIFSAEGAGERSVDVICNGVMQLVADYRNVVVVTADLFSDGSTYLPTTEHYRQFLGQINTFLAQRADVVIEVVCGIPLIHKDNTAAIKEMITL